MNPSRLMTQKVHVADADSAPDAFGQPTFGTPYPVPARVEYEVEVRRGLGEEAERKDVVYTLRRIAESSLVWLPGADTSNVSEARRPSPAGASPHPNGTLTLYKTEL